ncbi:hypothetical protein [Jhaorihella thermophila]|uniref:hypothetical protein n=1 Tax=Jhaorihella thermophila TaxID=488547 RepID=UPI0036214B97
MATSSTAPCPHGVAPNGCPISADAAAFRPFDGPYQLDPAEALRRARERRAGLLRPRHRLLGGDTV